MGFRKRRAAGSICPRGRTRARCRTPKNIRLAAKVRDEPEEDSESDTNHEASHNWKIERSVFAAVNDVPGKLSQAEWQLVPKIKESTDENDKPSEENERTSEPAKWIHKDNFT